MLKVAVFDNGWGGELVANFLSKELKMIEVIKVIDWHTTAYNSKSPYEIYQLALLQLEPYINKVDLIVLGGYVVSLAYEYLARNFPEQKIVGMTIDSYHFPQSYQELRQVALLANETLITNGSVLQEMHSYFPNSTLIAPDCSGWEDLINLGEMTAEVLRFELQDYFQLSSSQTRKSAAQSLLTTNYDLTAPKPKITSSTLRQQIASFLARDYSFGSVQLAVAQETAKDSCLAANYSMPTYNRTSYNDHATSYRSGLHQQTIDECTLLKPQLLLLMNTHYWEIRPELEIVFGSSVIILDFRQKLLHDVCLALELRGVDGRLGRKAGRVFTE